MQPTEEDIQLAVQKLIERHGDSLPNPEHHPRICATMLKHELYYIMRNKSENEQV